MLNNEIGSEFWSVTTAADDNGLFNNNVSWHLSGRAALNAIIGDIKERNDVKTAALPSYCCDSMILPFLNNGITVKFYSVYFENGELLQKIDEINDADIILLMDYFGFIRQKDIKTDAVVIRDSTHTALCEDNKKADYFFGSMRKWAGFYTGGFAYRHEGEKIAVKSAEKDSFYIALRKRAMEHKELYIGQKSASKDYLCEFAEAEEYLDNCFMGGADMRDINCALTFDVKSVREARRENARVLLREFSDIAVFKELKEGDCPLFVPLLIDEDKRDALKKHLIEKQIYCPVHWPISEFHRLNDKTEEIYKKEISIVCDQRYTVNDMERIVSEINNFLI